MSNDGADETGEPIEGDVTPPGKKGGKGKAQPRTGKGFGRQQTDDERKDEEDAAKAYSQAVAIGGLDWKHPGWEPSEKDRAMVRMLKFCGNTDEDIAGVLGMSQESLLKYFAFELKHAKTMIIGDLANRAYVRARQGNDVLTMFLLKTRGGSQFSERAVQMQALADGLDKNEPDDKRRAELVAQIVDLLDGRKRKSNQQQDKTSEGE